MNNTVKNQKITEKMIYDIDCQEPKNHRENDL